MILKTTMLATALVILLNNVTGYAQQGGEKWGWMMGAQSYSFHTFTFTEALDRIKSCNLRFVEAFPDQEIGGGIAGTMDYHMDAAKQQQVRKLLADKGIQMVSYGVVTPNNMADWKALFEFGKSMGLKNIASEPKPELLPMLSSLCDQYQINIAIHEHTKPESLYWDPAYLASKLKGIGSRVGACADVGHWVRSGLDPVEGLKQLSGRVVELHLKDMEKKAMDARDVVWGTGISNVKGMLDELRSQHFKGYVFIEYEDHPENNVSQIQASLANYDKMVASMQ